MRFLRRHGDAVYDALTDRRSRFVRVEDLVTAAADVVPGLVPTAQEIAAEEGCLQSEKGGLEIDQGLFLSAVLGSERSGRHLCHAMLLPRPEARGVAAAIRAGRRGRARRRIGRRRGKAAVVTQNNPRFLNAEDQTTLDGVEICVDLALLDRASEVAVMRGAVVEHPKYKDRRVFGAGINLTHLYHGRIPFLWYLQRDLGYVNKIYRGLALPDDAPPDEFGGRTIEKPWIAAVEAFAIGGHCQILLAMDYVLAERSAYMTLPARKEGIIPGAANMRLPRFTGDRIARQAIQYERRLECDSPEGRLICDEIVETGAMDAALERVVAGLDQFGRGQRGRQPARVPRHAGAARHVPPLLRGLCARAGLLPFQPGADRQSRALLERAEPQALMPQVRHAAWRCGENALRRSQGSEHEAAGGTPMIKTTLRLAGVAALALVCAPAFGQDTLKVAVGQRGLWDTSISDVGQRGGIFKKHGLTLDIVYTQGSGETQQAVISESVEVGVGVGIMGVLSAYSKGAPVRIIGTEIIGAGDLFWYVKANSPIKTLTDTNGKTIAYSTNGSSTHGVVTAYHQAVQL